MADTPFPRDPDRREFLTGRRSPPREGASDGAAEIASVLVRAKPERLDHVAHAIAALPGTQIYGREPAGKLVAFCAIPDFELIQHRWNILDSQYKILERRRPFHCDLLPSVCTATCAIRSTSF